MAELAATSVSFTPPEEPAAANVQTSEGPNGSIRVSPATDEPKKFAGKFDSPEALEAAYVALQTKLGERAAPEAPAQAQQGQPTTEQAAQAVAAAGLDLAALNAEFAQSGALSEASMAALTAKGISQETVQGYIAGQQALAAQRWGGMAEVVGGADALNGVLAWAKTGLSEGEAKAYNRAVDSGDMATAQLLMRGIHSKYVAANGSVPNLVRGANVPEAAGVKPYSSSRELAADMAKKDYQISPAFRAQVQARLAVSEIL